MWPDIDLVGWFGLYLLDGLGLDDGEQVSLTTLDGSFDSVEVRIQSSTPSNMLEHNGKPKAPTEAKISAATAAVQQNANGDSGG